MKQSITLNIGKIKRTVKQAKEHINTVILKPRLVISLGKIYQDYVLSYKYPDNFSHLLVWKEDGQHNCRYVLTWKKEKRPSFRFLWPCIVSKLWSERENQQDATVRYLLSIFSQHVSGIIMPIFRRTRRVLLHVVCCAVTSGEKVDISCNVFFVE